MNFKQIVILCLLILFTTIGINQTCPNPYTITFPALIYFGVVVIVWILFVFLLNRLYPSCDICEGYGAVNLNKRQKLVNEFKVGLRGEKCQKCNGSGTIDVYRFYKHNTERKEGK